MFSGHKGIKLRINNKKRAAKSPKNWRLKNILLSNTSVKNSILREIWGGTEKTVPRRKCIPLLEYIYKRRI